MRNPVLLPELSVHHRLWSPQPGPNSGQGNFPLVELVVRYTQEEVCKESFSTSVQLYFTKICFLVVSSLWSFAVGNITRGLVYREFQLCWSHQSWQMEDTLYHSCQRATDDCVKYFQFIKCFSIKYDRENSCYPDVILCDDSKHHRCRCGSVCASHHVPVGVWRLD